MDMVADKVADMVADTVADNKKVTFMVLDVVADKTADMVADMEADKKKSGQHGLEAARIIFCVSNRDSLFVDHPHWPKVHSKLFVWESAFSALRILAPVPPHGF